MAGKGADDNRSPNFKARRENYDRIFRKHPTVEEISHCEHNWSGESGEYRCSRCNVTPLELQQIVNELCK